ncbi:hypothetical protein D6764_00650 [Candidatus Woesearchaeota archaeon]|nr:MAG: hypothetical protein D6764_00650 [Candidatus Woesearchaeota archaeon]
MVKSNLKKHELVGLLLVFLAGTCLGIGLFIVLWGANRPLYYGSLDYLIRGRELIVFPLFFGTAALLWALGQVELRWMKPGRGLK